MNILVAIDSREQLHPGFDMLLTRAWSAATNIRVVTVIERLDSLSDILGVKDPSNAWIAEQTRIDKNLSYLAQVSQQIKARLPNVLFEERVLSGHVKEELISHAERWPADLMVVGSHHKPLFEMMSLGGVSQSILDHAPCSVHIARPTPHRTDSGDTLNILVPIDYSPHSYVTIDWLLRQNFKQPFRMQLFTALPPLSADFARENDPEIANQMLTRMQEANENASIRLDQFAQKMEQQLGKGVVDCVVQEGSPKDTILHAAKTWPAHLIVIGAHGGTGLTRALMGSVSKAVAAHAKCSVEVVRPTEEQKPPKPEPVEEVRREDENPRVPHVIPSH